MRVLLTGATGFVGSHVAKRLVREGCEVHILVREGSNPRRIQELLPLVHTVSGDLRDRDTIDRVAECRPDACVHAGWYASPGTYLRAPENVELLLATVRLAMR